ncbi:MAG TPA: hypothetical protein VEO95_02020, partial [Chthoniobacteraceae bacterium]|nr:hypothetical protein [Chthoniobacteraceae bacterium]
VTMHHPDGRHAVRFATPPDFRQEVAENVVKMPPNDSQLRSLLRQFRDLRNAECALLVLDRMLEGEPEDALLLRAWRADSLRLLKRREQAMRELEAILREAPLDAEALYVKAWCYFDANENGSGWHFIEQTLCSDPNHLHAIQDLFRHGSRVKDPTLAEEVADWAKEHRSWRGYWLASAQCSTLDANASALRYAQAAYELAPQERDALFLYANCLNDLEEGEHTAALIHPRLSAAKGDYELKYVFAGAMKKLGLPQEAIRILREALAEESEITVEWRKNCQHFLDELMGLLAVGDVEVEVHPNSDALRRSVWAGDDQGPKTELISGGVGLPAGRAVQMTPAPGYTGSTGSVGLFLHAHHTELEPVSLGFFRAHEIDFTSTEKPVMLVEATSRAKLEATARQGERRLPVTWSLYRVPSMETEGKPDDAGP